MLSTAGRSNFRPSGWNSTRFTRPDGATAVMVTSRLNAPDGITRVCGPTDITPPEEPTVFVAEAVGIGVQLNRPVVWSNEPSRLACGAGGGASGTFTSVQPEMTPIVTRTRANDRARARFICNPWFGAQRGLP